MALDLAPIKELQSRWEAGFPIATVDFYDDAVALLAEVERLRSLNAELLKAMTNLLDVTWSVFKACEKSTPAEGGQ